MVEGRHREVEKLGSSSIRNQPSLSRRFSQGLGRVTDLHSLGTDLPLLNAKPHSGALFVLLASTIMPATTNSIATKIVCDLRMTEWMFLCQSSQPNELRQLGP